MEKTRIDAIDKGSENNKYIFQNTLTLGRILTDRHSCIRTDRVVEDISSEKKTRVLYTKIGTFQFTICFYYKKSYSLML